MSLIKTTLAPRGGGPRFGNLRARVLNFQQRDENIRLAIQGSNLDLPVFSYVGKCRVNYLEYFVGMYSFINNNILYMQWVCLSKTELV
jgi:hypothetical protein